MTSMASIAEFADKAVDLVASWQQNLMVKVYGPQSEANNGLQKALWKLYLQVWLLYMQVLKADV